MEDKLKALANEVAEKIEWIEPYLYQDGTFGPDELPCEKIHLPDYAKRLDKEDFKDGDIDIINHLQPCESEHAIIEVVYNRDEDLIDVIVYHFEEEVFWMACDTTFDF